MDAPIISDPLAELLRTLRVQGAVYFVQEFSAPWGMRVPQRDHAQLHVVLDGNCEVEAESEVRIVGADEVLLFPYGAPHVLRSDGAAKIIQGRELVLATRNGTPPFQQGAATVRLLSGHFAFDRQARHPLLEGLPAVMHIPLHGAVDTALLTALFPLLQRQEGSASAETVVAKLCEIFLVQALEAHFRTAALPQDEPSLLRAIFDVRLRRAMTLVHARWRDSLSVDVLARAAGMSRTVFAARFVAATATTPMAYLARWRLLQARRLMLDTALSVAEVAEACGHGSPESFSRSFKQFYGISPAGLRSAEHSMRSERVISPS